MFHRFITSERLEQGKVEGGTTRLSNGKACAVSAVGALCFVSIIVTLYYHEIHNVDQHLASDSVESSGRVQEVPCEDHLDDGFEGPQAPEYGLIHLAGCNTDTGVDAIFPGFDDVLPPGIAGKKYAWAKLRIQHYTESRRRGGSYEWENVDSDGRLTAHTRVAPKVKVGPYSLTDPALIAKIPELHLKLQPPPWQQHNQPAPIKNQQWFGGDWILNSSSMSYADDCNCLWVSDTRVFITVADPHFSFLGGACPGWTLCGFEDSIGEKIATFEAGTVDAKNMFSLRLGRRDLDLWVSRLTLGFGLGCCFWYMVWPLVALISTVNICDAFCKGCIAETFCGEWIGDAVTIAAMAGQSGCERCCSTWCRAMGLGMIMTVLICFTGWVGYRYNIVFALIIGFGVCAVEFVFRQLRSSEASKGHVKLEEYSSQSDSDA
eukprot:TRINITY_DN47741_c0_g1_i1.p1 TRINITY_DN47741_c0_g1~~TRINITY_DN47741_c0_g1_i1.p1  ORF type:complete len:433 (-),score=37.00 TRINITY_DN47741_c0_g1_i1:64-1362(-)